MAVQEIYYGRQRRSARRTPALAGLLRTGSHGGVACMPIGVVVAVDVGCCGNESKDFGVGDEQLKLQVFEGKLTITMRGNFAQRSFLYPWL